MTTFEDRLERVRTKNERANQQTNAKVLLHHFESLSRKYLAEPNPGRLLDLFITEQKYNALFA